jgi:ThiF family/Prokaryotic homologs of the JAB domain
MDVTLTLNAEQHAALHAHLFPGDGYEAAAIILCGRRAGDRRQRLVAREVHPIPYEECSARTPQRVTWPTHVIAPLLDRAEARDLTIVKVHSHPTSYEQFSATDDEGDRRLLSSIRDWFDIDLHHSSTAMLPDGRMFGRCLTANGGFQPLTHINIAGDDLKFWYPDQGKDDTPDFASSHTQAFGEGTFERQRRLSVAVIGCSGTGSPVIEQLARLGVGELVMIDDDKLEVRNVNRILNATMADVRAGRLKVEVLTAAVKRMETGTRVIPIPRNLWTPDAVQAVGQCDLAFGCMDTVDGRFLLNTIAAYYQLPYIDLGVRIAAVPEGPRKGQIVAICGSVHYLKPGGSSLISRGLFTMEDARAAGLARTDPTAHAQQLEEGYVSGVAIHRPAVVTLNMLIASLGVNELLARLHPYCDEANEAYDHIQVNLGDMEIIPASKNEPCPIFQRDVGKGDVRPLLDLPQLSAGVG